MKNFRRTAIFLALVGSLSAVLVPAAGMGQVFAAETAAGARTYENLADIPDIFVAKDDSKLEKFKARIFNGVLHKQASIDVSDIQILPDEIIAVSTGETGVNGARRMIMNHSLFSSLATMGWPTFTTTPEGYVSTVEYSYHPAWKEDTIKSTMAAYDEIMSLINDNDDDFAKILKFHDWIVKNVSYSLRAPNADYAVGALAGRKAVCAGYTRCMQFLLDQAGIENIYIAARAKPETHAWNLVKYQGHWFHVDCTWDRGITGQYVQHKYFMLNDAEFTADGEHTAPENMKDQDWTNPSKKYPQNNVCSIQNKWYAGSGRTEIATDEEIQKNPIILNHKYNGDPVYTKTETGHTSTCAAGVAVEEPHSTNKLGETCSVCGYKIVAPTAPTLDEVLGNEESRITFYYAPETVKLYGSLYEVYVPKDGATVPGHDTVATISGNQQSISITPLLDAREKMWIYVRKKATGSIPASGWLKVPVEGRPDVPSSVPEIPREQVTDTSITIPSADAACEYLVVKQGEATPTVEGWRGRSVSLGDGAQTGAPLTLSWDNKGAALEKNTEYEVLVRRRATRNFPASKPATPATGVKTKDTQPSPDSDVLNGMVDSAKNMTSTVWVNGKSGYEYIVIPNGTDAASVTEEQWAQNGQKPNSDGAFTFDKTYRGGSIQPGTEYVVRVRKPGSDALMPSNARSSEVTKTEGNAPVKQPQTPPDSDVLNGMVDSAENTTSTVWVNGKSGYEYIVIPNGTDASSVTEEQWTQNGQKPNSDGFFTFDKTYSGGAIQPGTEYVVLVRKPGSDALMPSDARSSGVTATKKPSGGNSGGSSGGNSGNSGGSTSVINRGNLGTVVTPTTPSTPSAPSTSLPVDDRMLDTKTVDVALNKGYAFLVRDNNDTANLRISVGNPNILDVKLDNASDPRGAAYRIVPKAVGETTITVSDQGKMGVMTVRITEMERQNLRLDTQAVNVAPSKSYAFLVRDNADAANIQIAVANPNILDVKLDNASDPRGAKFRVIPKTAGKTEVTVTYQGQSSVLTVNVPTSAGSLTLDTRQCTMAPGMRYTIGAALTDEAGNQLTGAQIREMVAQGKLSVRDSRTGSIVDLVQQADGNYQVVAKNPGTAYIIYEIGGIRNSVRIDVQNGAAFRGTAARDTAYFTKPLES